MKKNRKTALTAALFAAAMNVVPGGMDANAVTDIPTEIDRFDPAREEQPAVYGPPIAFEEPTEEWTDPIPQPDYGPIPVMTDPMPEPTYGAPVIVFGDLDGDGKVTSFDMVRMRRVLAEGVAYEDDIYPMDINMDGHIGIADMVMLQRYLLGRINELDPGSALTEDEALDELCPQTIPQTTDFTPLYGPPWVMSSIFAEQQKNNTTTTVADFPEEYDDAVQTTILTDKD